MTVELDFAKSKDGLLPAIVQDYASGDVLMLAYINKESWEKSLETRKAHFWSRSRQQLWLKGESSGHIQLIKEILLTAIRILLFLRLNNLVVRHVTKGYGSCFYRMVDDGDLRIISKRVFDPAVVYK